MSFILKIKNDFFRKDTLFAFIVSTLLYYIFNKDIIKSIMFTISFIIVFLIINNI
jgi:uncharacterized MAPEG superfamily protein